jgi:hypothetical protein
MRGWGFKIAQENPRIAISLNWGTGFPMIGMKRWNNREKKEQRVLIVI